MAKRDKAGDDSPADLLDIRGLDYNLQIILLQKHYKKAYDIWRNYPQVDPRLKEHFRVVAEALEDLLMLRS